MDKSQQTHKRIAAEKEDILGPNYQAITLESKPNQICTLVRYLSAQKSEHDCAILYVHGYTDYFYQTQLAEFIAEQGFDFYAVDLHGYGRSIRPYQQDHNQNHFPHYFDDIDACLSKMAAQGVQRCILLGHSTGGLVTTRYLSHLEQTKPPVPKIIGMILNSPFFSLPMPLTEEKWRLPLYKVISRLLESISLPAKKPTLYAQSIHKSLSGEWRYRLDWKPSQGSPLSFSWLHQIMQQQAACLTQKSQLPTLLCRSSRSTYQAHNLIDIQQGDGVLDVGNMEAKAKQIFANLEVKCIDKGFHDLTLSSTSARQDYYNTLKHWLTQYKVSH